MLDTISMYFVGVLYFILVLKMSLSDLAYSEVLLESGHITSSDNLYTYVISKYIGLCDNILLGQSGLNLKASDIQPVALLSSQQIHSTLFLGKSLIFCS